MAFERESNSTDWPVVVAKYLRWQWKADHQKYTSGGLRNGYLESVFDRSDVTEAKLRDMFTDEEWVLIYSDGYVEVLDKW